MSLFFNKKYPVTIQTDQAQIVTSMKLVLIAYLEMIGVENQLLITFGIVLIYFKILKNYTTHPKHKFLTFNITTPPLVLQK